MPDFYSLLMQLWTRSNIIFVSGASGTGKTSLVQFLVGNALAHDLKNKSCVWIQASEPFPSTRFKAMQPPELLKHIYVTPPSGVYQNYLQQEMDLRAISSGIKLLPPSLFFLVIDNISHHLRYEISQTSDISRVTRLMDKFYAIQLQPLILKCMREGIRLILIHEVSYNPNLGKEAPFFHKLYDRVKGVVRIHLVKDLFSKKLSMHLNSEEQSWTGRYKIHSTGFLFV